MHPHFTYDQLIDSIDQCLADAVKCLISSSFCEVKATFADFANSPASSVEFVVLLLLVRLSHLARSRLRKRLLVISPERRILLARLEVAM
jgi:hypothetical protein